MSLITVMNVSRQIYEGHMNVARHTHTLSHTHTHDTTRAAHMCVAVMCVARHEDMTHYITVSCSTMSFPCVMTPHVLRYTHVCGCHVCTHTCVWLSCVYTHMCVAVMCVHTHVCGCHVCTRTHVCGCHARVTT